MEQFVSSVTADVTSKDAAAEVLIHNMLHWPGAASTPSCALI